MNIPKVINRYPEAAGKSYCPSNGTEGMMFTDAFCDNCIHEKWSHSQNDDDKKCDILSNTMVYDRNDPKYPKEWVYNKEGWPVCTAWIKWDWGRDDDGNWIDPIDPEPEDPNQLCLPLIFNEITESVMLNPELTPHPKQ